MRAGVGLSGAHRGLVLSIYYTARCSGLPSVPTSFNRLARAHVGLPSPRNDKTPCFISFSCYATEPLNSSVACTTQRSTRHGCDTFQFHLRGSDFERDMDTQSIWPPDLSRWMLTTTNPACLSPLFLQTTQIGLPVELERHGIVCYLTA
jgi:hypothetical protein